MSSKVIERVSKNSNWGWIIIILAAAGVRIALPWLRSFDSIWQDEAWSIMISELNLRDLFHLNFVCDTVTPLYYLLLKAWRMLFGSLELPMRMLSVFFGLFSLPLTFLVVRQRFRNEIAYLSTFLIALTPQLIGTSTEIRYYSLLLSLSLLLIYITNVIIDISWSTKSKDKNKTYLLLWVICAFLLMMTHHFGGWVLLGCIVYLIISLNKRNLPAISDFYGPSFIGLILAFIWVSFFISQIKFLGINHSSLSSPSVNDLVRFWVDSLFLGISYQTIWLIVGFSIFILFIFFSIIGLKSTETKLTRNFIILLLFFAVLVPVITFLISDLLESPQLLSRRYVPIVAWSVCMLAGYILENQEIQIGWIFQKYTAIIKLAFKVLLTSMMLLGLVNIVKPDGPFSYPDWRGAANILKNRVRPIDLIVVCEPDNDLAIRYSPCLNYYMPWYSQSWRTGPGGVINKGPEQLVRGVNISGQGKVIKHLFESLRNRSGLRVLDNYYQRFISVKTLEGDLDRMKGDTIVWIVIPKGEEEVAYQISEQLKLKFKLFEINTDFKLRKLLIVRMQRIG